jgi:hypothetical protein
MPRKSQRHPKTPSFSPIPPHRILFGPAAGLLLFCACAQSESLVDSALRIFLGNDSNTQGFDLDKSRPKPVSPDLRARALAMLPEEGRIRKVQGSLQLKLESLEAVLHAQQRQSVYEICIFHAEPKPFAFVGLHERAAVLISDAALSLLTAEELKASVAHEIGHEYIWTEYIEGAKRGDNRRLKELELFCDGVAILTLQRVGLSPAPLLTAAERVERFNRLSTGPAGNAERYPTAGERRAFANAVISWANAHRE